MAYTKYLAKIRWSFEIKPLQVISETEHFVTLESGRRAAKKTDYEVICDTHEQAVFFINERLTNEVETAKKQLANCETTLNNFKQKHGIQ